MKASLDSLIMYRRTAFCVSVCLFVLDKTFSSTGAFRVPELRTVYKDESKTREIPGSPKPTSRNRASFKAAVYEHAVIIAQLPSYSRQGALMAMWKNLDIYENQVITAASQMADIIVFPEDGIYGLFMNRDKIEPFLEFIPDPRQVHWNPCLEPMKYPNTDVQRRLSCMAMKNKIYLVANFGDRKPCNTSRDPNCPSDGRYQYNTDIVYSPEGVLIARYHKQNLYGEHQFNTPRVAEQIFFDTSFGRLGVFTCFDILFKSPAVDLLENHNIDTVLFPTAWMDALPFMPAIGYHSGFSVMMNVNLLAANIHMPSKRFGGSGLYTPVGEAAFYRDEFSSNGKLLLAEIPSQYQRLTRRPNLFHSSSVSSITNRGSLGQTTSSNKICDFKSQCRNFQSVVFNDTYSFMWLKPLSGSVKVCQGAACCYLDYIIRSGLNTSGDSYFALGVFDGLHSSNIKPFYLQVCTLLKCGNSHSNSCGEVVKESDTFFSSVVLRGQFTTPYIAPEILAMDENRKLALVPNGWEYDQDTRTLTARSVSLPVVSVNLVGRWYSRDREKSYPSQIVG